MVALSLQIRVPIKSEIDALKLTLAAQMARAVDPRDAYQTKYFEVQLKRPGSLSVYLCDKQAGASLVVVIGEPERQRRRLLILNEVASAESFESASSNLKADRIVGRLAAAYAGETSGQGHQS